MGDRTEYMRQYMQDKRNADKLGMTIKAYKQMVTNGDVPATTPDTAVKPAKRTYTKQSANITPDDIARADKQAWSFIGWLLVVGGVLFGSIVYGIKRGSQ